MKRIWQRIRKRLGMRMPMNDVHPLEIEMYVETMCFFTFICGMVFTGFIVSLLAFVLT